MLETLIIVDQPYDDEFVPGLIGRLGLAHQRSAPKVGLLLSTNKKMDTVQGLSR